MIQEKYVKMNYICDYMKKYKIIFFEKSVGKTVFTMLHKRVQNSKMLEASFRGARLFAHCHLLEP